MTLDAQFPLSVFDDCKALRSLTLHGSFEYRPNLSAHSLFLVLESLVIKYSKQLSPGEKQKNLRLLKVDVCCRKHFKSLQTILDGCTNSLNKLTSLHWQYVSLELSGQQPNHCSVHSTFSFTSSPPEFDIPLDLSTSRCFHSLSHCLHGYNFDQ